MKIFVLHDDELFYFEALKALEKAKEIEIESYHVHFIKTFFKGIIKGRPEMSLKAAQSFIFFLRSFFLTDRVIMIGIAPYDPALMFWKRMLKQNTVILHASWPYWGNNRQLIRPFIFAGVFKRMWEVFMKDKGLFVVCVLEETKDELIRVYGKKKENISVIPHAVNTSNFKPLRRVHNSMNVLFSGRLVEEKGLEDLVKVIESMDPANYSFGIAGDGRDRRMIEGIIKNTNVTYYGMVKDRAEMANIFRAHDVFLLPSFRTKTWEELFGIVLIEAFASGLAVISTDCVGPKNIITHMKDGIIVKQRDTADMIKKIELLRKNRMLKMKISRNALKTAQRYRLDNVIKLWKSILNVVKGGNK